MVGLEIGIIYIAALVFVIWITFVVPYQMAARRDRNPIIWVLISLFGSAILAILLLLALGPAPQSDRH